MRGTGYTVSLLSPGYLSCLVQFSVAFEQFIPQLNALQG